MSAHTQQTDISLSLQALTLFIWLALLDDLECVHKRGLLSLLFHQELHQILGTHEACSFGILSVDHVDFLPFGQQLVQVLDLFPRQAPGFRFVTFLCVESAL